MRTSLFACILAILVFGSCSEIEDLLRFNVSNSVSMTVPAAAPLNLPFEISTPEVTTNSTKEFENNNTKAELVRDVKLKSLSLKITAPTEYTFNFLKSIEIYIRTSDDNEILLASLYDVPANVNKISLTPTGAKLDVYAKASNYQLRTKVVTKETVTHDIDLYSEITFRVTADPM